MLLISRSLESLIQKKKCFSVGRNHCFFKEIGLFWMLDDAVLEIVMILDERKRERKLKSLYLAEFPGSLGFSEPGIKHRLKVFTVICGSLFK